MRPAWRSVRLIQAAWLALAVAGAGGWMAGPILSWDRLRTVCHPDSSCQPWQLGAEAATTLSRHGLSPLAFAVFTMAVMVFVAVVWYGLGTLIVLRKPDDRGALLAAFFLAVFPVWGDTSWLPNSELTYLLGGAFMFALLLFGLLFPDGRFALPWTRWLAIGIATLIVVASFPLPAALDSIGPIVIFGVFAGVVAAQIQRYRTVSSWKQRQQTKWGIMGFAIAILGLIALWTATSVAPFPTGRGSLALAVINVCGTSLLVTAVPAFIGISVLRNRLWDIDRVINRALVYASLTITIAALYAGCVVTLQALFRLIAGQQSTLAIALSTLAIAAIFGPLRRRIQAVIDRRFYRRKYHAARTLAAFGERLRDEVDLMQLSQELTVVVSETLQPEHVSLWLRP